ncbi:MAG: Gfo/Idh/MocA family oxidoreductase, partial [Clostridia bacterium]
GHAIKALNLGYHLLLEKPVSPFIEQVKEIRDLAASKRLNVVVCHVLRYSPYYETIKNTLDSGVIGDIVNINHTENVGYWHFSHSFVRGNWRREEETSPVLLAKCCHDLDIIHWFTGKRAVSVSSYGDLSHFTHSNRPKDAPAYCLDGCPHERTCPYHASKIYYKITRHTLPLMVVNMQLITEVAKPTLRLLKDTLKTSPYGRCVYACDNDVLERQVTQIVLENNVTATLTMCAFSKRCYRKIHIYGTKGEIYGNDIDGNFTVNVFGEKSRKVRPTRKEISIHNNADKGIISEFVKLLEGRSVSRSLTTIAETVESHNLAHFAEIARKNGTIEKIEE